MYVEYVCTLCEASDEPPKALSSHAHCHSSPENTHSQVQGEKPGRLGQPSVKRHNMVAGVQTIVKQQEYVCSVCYSGDAANSTLPKFKPLTCLQETLNRCLGVHAIPHPLDDRSVSYGRQQLRAARKQQPRLTHLRSQNGVSTVGVSS